MLGCSTLQTAELQPSDVLSSRGRVRNTCIFLQGGIVTLLRGPEEHMVYVVNCEGDLTKTAQ